MTVTIENTNVDTVLNIAELTTASLTGTGVFDVLLQTLRLHLDREFTSGRITGTAYATVYSQALTAVLQQSVGFCLSKTKLALELQQMQEQVVLLQKQQDQIQAETSHIGKQELGTIQQTRNLESQQAQIEATTDRLIYETTTKLPEEVQLIKLNQDQLIAQNNKIATDTVVTIKQGHLTDAQTCQVTAQTNQVNAEVALKLPEEVELVKRNQTMLTTQIAQVNAETTLKLPEEVEVLKKNQAQITAQIAEINYRTTTLMPSQTAQTTAQTAQVTYTTANLLPEQLAQLTAQIAGTTAQTAQVTYTTANILPKQVLLTQAQADVANAQTTQLGAQTAQVTYTTANLLPAQVTNTSAQTANMAAQTDLYAQKKVTELAQTTSTPAAGSVMGVQNALMAQQQENYLRDAEQKAAKIMIETWAVRQNTDGGQVVTTNHLGDTYIATAVDALLAGI